MHMCKIVFLLKLKEYYSPKNYAVHKKWFIKYEIYDIHYKITHFTVKHEQGCTKHCCSFQMNGNIYLTVLSFKVKLLHPLVTYLNLSQCRYMTNPSLFRKEGMRGKKNMRKITSQAKKYCYTGHKINEGAKSLQLVMETKNLESDWEDLGC